MEYPYSDDNMVWDPQRNRYYITSKALLDEGIDLAGRLAARKAISPDKIINNLFSTATRHVYAFIHAHSVHNNDQDYAIAVVPRLRSIIYEALMTQTKYILNVGDLSNSVKPEERAAVYHPLLEEILDIPLTELGGRSILYTGV